VSEVRGFLGMVGIVRSWIREFVEVVDPLTKLMRVIKGELFWEEEQKLVMNEMKERVATCKVI